MRTRLTAPPGGVLTDEVGAITGDLEVWLAGDSVRVTYVGSSDVYTVSGSPAGASLEQVVEHLQATPTPDETGNAAASDLRTIG